MPVRRLLKHSVIDYVLLYVAAFGLFFSFLLVKDQFSLSTFLYGYICFLALGLIPGLVSAVLLPEIESLISNKTLFRCVVVFLFLITTIVPGLIVLVAAQNIRDRLLMDKTGNIPLVEHFAYRNACQMNTPAGEVVVLKIKIFPKEKNAFFQNPNYDIIPVNQYLKRLSGDTTFRYPNYDIIPVNRYLKQLSGDTTFRSDEVFCFTNQMNHDLPDNTIRFKYKDVSLDLFYPYTLEKKISWLRVDQIKHPEYFYYWDQNGMLIYDPDKSIAYIMVLIADSKDVFRSPFSESPVYQIEMEGVK